MSVTNVSVPNTGTAPIAVISDGTQSHQTIIAEYLPTSGSTSPVQIDKAANNLPAQTMPRLIVVSASSFTRPANTTAYTPLNAVSNNVTAGSVTPVSFTAVDINGAPLTIDRVRISTTDTGASTAGASFRVWFYQSSPTVLAGDGAAFSTNRGTFIGSMTGNLITFGDGGVALCTSEVGSRIITLPTSSAETVFALLQTLTTFTPLSASTFTLTIEGFQGRT